MCQVFYKRCLRHCYLSDKLQIFEDLNFFNIFQECIKIHLIFLKSLQQYQSYLKNHSHIWNFWKNYIWIINEDTEHSIPALFMCIYYW